VIAGRLAALAGGPQNHSFERWKRRPELRDSYHADGTPAEQMKEPQVNIHTTTSSPTTSGHPRRNLLVATAALALAAAMIVSVWPRGAGHESSAPAIKAPVAGGQLLVQTGPGRVAGSATHTVYIVGSEAEAARIRGYLSESDSMRANVGEMPLDDEVRVAAAGSDATRPLARTATSITHTIYVVGSEAEAARIWGYLSESDSMRANVGEMPLDDEVVVAATNGDATQPPVQTVASGQASGAATHTVYVVGSEAEAARIWGYLSESDSARATVGEMPLRDEVVVAADGKAAAANGIDNRTVDLRR
jgi:phage-related protein